MIYFSRNPIWQQGTASEANLEVVLELMIESEHLANDHTAAIQMQMKSDADGFFAFRLDSQLNAHLKVDLPDLSTGNHILCKKAIREFYVRLAEIDPSTGILSAFVDQTRHTVVMGGVSQEDFQEGAFFSSAAPVNEQFLTWHPDNKVIYAYAPEYLTALVNSPIQSQIFIYRDYLIGSVPYQYKEAITVIPGKPQMITFKVLKSLPSGATSVDVHIRVDAWVGGPEDEPEQEEKELTQHRYYIIDSTEKTRRHFMFVNSLGALDTLTCTGKRVSVIDGKEEIAETSPGITGYDLTAGQSYAWSSDASRVIRQSTGYLSAVMRHWLQEFAISKGGRWEVINSKFRPILLKKRGFPFQNDDKDPAGLTFEFESGFGYTAYSPSN